MSANTIKDEAKQFCKTGVLRATVQSYTRDNAEKFWRKVREIEAYNKRQVVR